MGWLRRTGHTLWMIGIFGAFGCGGANDTEGTPPYRNSMPAGELRGEANFAALIRKYSRGRVLPIPWAGYWWPYLQNGVSSADEKYEAVTSTSGVTQWEEANHGPGVPGIQDWWGHCNGWAAAAVLFKEPQKAISRNGTNFSIGDQKALLSEIAMEVNGEWFGHRVDDPDDLSSMDFQDIFPDQFFLVLTNIVGKGMPLIVDRYTGDQVWNQPVAGYSIDPVTPADDLGVDPASPDVHRVMVSMTIWWANDDVIPDFVTEPFAFADSDSFGSRTLRAEIWMDGAPRFDGSGKLIGSGNVILTRQDIYVLGGAWRTGDLELADSYPDYIWIPYSVKASSGVSNPKLDPDQVIRMIQQ